MKRHGAQCRALAAAVLALCVLAGCSGEPSGIQVLEAPNTQPEYLSFFSSTSLSSSGVTKYWADRFTELYNKQVYVNFEGATYYAGEGLSHRDLLEKRLGSSAPDDLYIISAEDVLEFDKKGYWMDLSDMAFVDNLSEAALYQSTYNGKVFSIPLTFTGFGFVWNMELLEDHGLAVPQNREEFLAVCETLKNAGILPYGANKGYGLTVPAMCAGLSQLYNSPDQQSGIAALNSGEAPISSYLRAGYEFLSLLMKEGYLDPEQALETTPREEDVGLFLAGECAFICAGLGDLDNLAKEAPYPIQMTGLPVLEEGCAAVYGADKRLCVNPASRHLDTALQFIEMVGSPEALAESAALDHAMSSAKDGAATAPPEGDALVELLRQPNQVPNQDFSLHFNTWESIRDVARELCAGASVDQACAMLDEKQQAELLEYGQ